MIEEILKRILEENLHAPVGIVILKALTLIKQSGLPADFKIIEGLILCEGHPVEHIWIVLSTGEVVDPYFHPTALPRESLKTFTLDDYLKNEDYFY